MDNLPEEVLEFILSLISPYDDLHSCLQVSKKWRRSVRNVVKLKQRNLYKAINEFDVRWETVYPIELGLTVTKRYSHTAVVHQNAMYVFGGCTSAMTTFNDLWKLDLSHREWIRPLATGTFPSPKACSSLARYNDCLILFGGWAYPPSYPLYQSWHLFNELHVYDIFENKWTSVNTLNTPPPMAGHSVSIINNWMIIFGGLQKPNTCVHCEKSNDIWKLNLDTWTWNKQQVDNGPKPHGRFGQTQVVINDENILILGGSGGPSSYFCDAWLLNMSGPLWKWNKVKIEGSCNEPTNIWSNPGCRINDKIVVLNRIRQSKESTIAYYPKISWSMNNRTEDGQFARIDLANRQTDKDDNVNGKRGVLRNPKREAEAQIVAKTQRLAGPKISVPTSSRSMAAFSLNPNNSLAEIRKEKRLANLQNVQEKLDQKLHNKKDKKAHHLGIFVLDIAEILQGKEIATWLPPTNLHNGPEETILYTLVEGKSELIMFGGIQKEANSVTFSTDLTSQISNSVHFITSPNYVI